VLSGLEVGAARSESERLRDLHEAAGGLPLDGIWALVAVLEHVARRWMSEYMEPGEQSVGARVHVERRGAPCSDLLVSTAILREVNGRRYLFDVELRDETGALVATGWNERSLISVRPQT
jgi:predicted thioesterase